jgi:hypothetical protein
MKVLLAFAFLILTGCSHVAARLSADDCGGVPSRHVPGATFETWELNFISAHLRELGEPVLRAPGDETFRFTIAPHNYNPVSIRVVQRADSFVLYTARHTGAGGWCPEDFPRSERQRWRRQRTLTAAEAQLVATAINYFNISPRPPEEVEAAAPGEIIIKLHATQYLLESRGHSAYQFVFRQAGDPTVEEGSFRHLCAVLLGVANLRLERPGAYCAQEAVAQPSNEADRPPLTGSQ